MKTLYSKVMAVVMGIAMVSFIISFAATGTHSNAAAASQKSGFLHGYYEKLKPGKTKDEAKLVWFKPGVDYSKYKKVMVDYVIFAFDDESEYKAIDANEMKRIADGASTALVHAVDKVMPVVSEPGPDVLRVRTAIVDLKQSHPALSAVTSVVPVGLGISLFKKGATGSWTGSGATTAEMMLMDSVTNEVLAAGEDHMAAEFDDRFTKWGSEKEAFEFWSEHLAKRLTNFTKRR